MNLINNKWQCLLKKVCPPNKLPKILLQIAVVLTGSVLLFLGIALGYQQMYINQVYPGVKVGNYELDHFNKKEIADFIEGINNRYSREGLDLTVANSPLKENKVKFNLIIAGDSTVELIRLDSGIFAESALAVGRNGSFFANLWTPLYIRFIKPIKLSIPVIADDPTVLDVLKNSLGAWEDKARNADIEFDSNLNPKVVAEKPGTSFDYIKIALAIKRSVSNLSFDPVVITLEKNTPTITSADVEKIIPNVSHILQYGNLSLNFINPETKLRQDWDLTPSQLAQLTGVTRDDNEDVIFNLKKSQIKKYLEEAVEPAVNIAPQEAKFTFENNKVKEFQASRTGLSVDADKTYSELDTAFRARNYNLTEPIKTVSVSVVMVEPKIKMADINDLGISGIVGVGVSSFKGSHVNRIKNIAHAVNRLNGILIKPGEDFSANRFAGPYTAENGFLPELVIKGREVKPEIGGGMCQIGTTLFRMAMNSGMPITERHNHSLVVNYYADPVNNNPGTDATLYEPVLDFKFKNDTGHYLLLQTAMDYKKLELTFTLWGTPDGRSGSYTHPIVSKWIPTGEPQEIKSDDGKLKPGEKKCQIAYKGAVASFTYTRVTPQGEKIDRIFDSYYRPLPKICMVGVEKGPVCKEGEVCPPKDTSTTSTTESIPVAN